MKKERATTSDEQRERLLIAEQIERAAAEQQESGGSSESPPPVDEGLKRDEGSEKLVLSFAPKPSTSKPVISLASKPAFGGLKVHPLKPSVNPLKRPNVFKQATSSTTPSSDSDKANGKKREFASMSAAERLISEDQERKRRKMEREAAA